MIGPHCYCTLPMFRVRQGWGTTDTGDDARAFQKIRAATAEIERHCARFFQPRIETHAFDYTSAQRLFFRGQEALAITSITDGQGFNVPTANVIMLGGEDASVGPWYGFECDQSKQFLTYLATKVRAITIAGTWGWHDDWANAFYDSGVTVQDNPLSAGATSITTSTNDSTIVDAWGQQWPAAANAGTVHPGHMIQIDSEWIQVVARPDATHLTVLRAQNGSTAAAHNQGKSIQLYAVPRDVQDLCLRWAAWLYAQDSINFNKTVIPAMGAMEVPAGFPRDIWEALTPLRRTRVA